MKMQRRVSLLLLGMSAGVNGFLLASCGDGSSDAGPLPHGTTQVPPSRTPDLQQAGAVEAYRAMWNDLTSAAATSDATYPRLEVHAAGAALELLRYMMTEDHKKGVITKGHLRLDPLIKKSNAKTVVITDCADATHWLHYTTGGGLQDDASGGHHRVEATVQRHGGAWKVGRLYIDRVGTC